MSSGNKLVMIEFLDGEFFLNQNLNIARVLLPNMFLSLDISHQPRVGIRFYYLENQT